MSPSQTRLLSNIADVVSNATVRTQLNTSLDVVAAKHSRQLTCDNGAGAPTLLLYGSAEDGIDMLLKVLSHVYRLLKPRSQATVGPEIEWFVSELCRIPKDGIANKVIDLKAESLRPYYLRGATSKQTKLDDGSSHLTHQQLSKRRLPMCSDHAISKQVQIDDGRITIVLGTLTSWTASAIPFFVRIGQLCFVPQPGSALSGLSIHCYWDSATTSYIPRTLSTFRIHAIDAAIFSAIKNRDLIRVQEILSTGSVSPNDRDEEGNTLLYVSRDNKNVVIYKDEPNMHHINSIP